MLANYLGNCPVTWYVQLYKFLMLIRVLKQDWTQVSNIQSTSLEVNGKTSWTIPYVAFLVRKQNTHRPGSFFHLGFREVWKLGKLCTIQNISLDIPYPQFSCCQFHFYFDWTNVKVGLNYVVSQPLVAAPLYVWSIFSHYCSSEVNVSKHRKAAHGRQSERNTFQETMKQSSVTVPWIFQGRWTEGNWTGSLLGWRLQVICVFCFSVRKCWFTEHAGFFKGF